MVEKKQGQVGIALVAAICFLIALLTPWFRVTQEIPPIPFFSPGCTIHTDTGLWKLCYNKNVLTCQKDKQCSKICEEQYNVLTGEGCMAQPDSDLNTARAFTIISLVAAFVAMGICAAIESKLIHTVFFAGTCACGIIAMAVYTDQVDSSNWDQQGYFVGFAFIIIGWMISGIGAVVSFFGICFGGRSRSSPLLH
eukprot:g77805.t1